MAAEPPAGNVPGAGPGSRAELRAAAPFLGWTRIYLIVVGALAAEIVAFAIITSAFK